jgi:uncharacterized membrane protein YkvI
VNKLHAIVVPAAVFQSVIVGGAYGTGREVVEFISSYGALGGLLAIAVAGLCFGLVLAASFEFARVFAAWDYRHFLRALLGPAWITYELMFGALLIIILAVTGAAAGNVLADALGVPSAVGVAVLFVLVVSLNFFGRRIVERTLSVGALVLLTGLLAYGIAIFIHEETELWSGFSADSVGAGWWLSGIKFAVYNSALVPVLLYSARNLPDRASTLWAGALAALFGVLPAALFHLTFIAGGPELIHQPLPTYWMIERFIPAAAPLYVIILFATIVQTGVGVLQGLNERLDGWYREKHARTLSPTFHAVVAGCVLLCSLLLSHLGLVALVARGYGGLAWGFFFVFTLPLLTAGLRKIVIRETEQIAS